MKRSTLCLILLVSLCSESGCATTPRPSPTAGFAAAPAKQPSWFQRILGASLTETAKQAPGSPR
jgi:hypothetical protein